MTDIRFIPLHNCIMAVEHTGMKVTVCAYVTVMFVVMATDCVSQVGHLNSHNMVSGGNNKAS